MRKLFFCFFTFMFFMFSVQAEEKIDFSCDKNKLNVGEQTVCRFSLKSSKNYNLINYKIDLGDGLELVDVRSNYNDLWVVGRDSAKSNNVVTGLQEFGIFLIKATNSGSYDINFSDISYGVSNNLDDVYNLDDVSYKIKVISADNYLKSITINNELLSNFDKNLMFYDYETDLDEINVGAVLNNEFSTLSGNGKFLINKNSLYSYIFINVVSESNVSRVYVIRVKNLNYKFIESDVKIDSLMMKNDKGSTILFGFKSDIYYYDIQVSSDTLFINIDASIGDDLSFLKDYSGGKYNLNVGNNIISIKVKDKNSREAVYVFNVLRPTGSLSSNSYIKSLKINGYDLKFSKKVKTYNLDIKRSDKSLDFNVELDDNNSIYKIVGNENLKKGSQVKIVVTAPDNSSTTYYINIGLLGFNFSYILYVLGFGFVGYFIYKNKGKLKSSIYDLDLDDLEKIYNKEFGDRGITRSFNKMSDSVKKNIYIEAISKKIVVNKTSCYKSNYRLVKNSSSKKKAKSKKR